MNLRRLYSGGWPLPVRDQMIVALVSALIVAGKMFIKSPIRVPGHSGFFWMALIIIGVAVIRRPGAGTMIGIVSGLLATMLTPGRLGILAGVKYFVPGVVVDALYLAFGGRFDRVYVAVVVAATANVAKLAANYIAGVVLGIPAGYLALGLGVASTTHVLFGALGGAAAAVVLQRLDRTGALDRLLPRPAGGLGE